MGEGESEELRTKREEGTRSWGGPHGARLRVPLVLFRHVLPLFQDLTKDRPFFQLEAGRIPVPTLRLNIRRWKTYF